MADQSVDSSGNTEQFRAFVQRDGDQPAAKSRVPLIVGVAVAALVIVAVIVALAI